MKNIFLLSWIVQSCSVILELDASCHVSVAGDLYLKPVLHTCVTAAQKDKLYPISVDNCARACNDRSDCSSFTYRRNFLECSLNIGISETPTKCRGHLHWEKKEFNWNDSELTVTTETITSSADTSTTTPTSQPTTSAAETSSTTTSQSATSIAETTTATTTSQLTTSAAETTTTTTTSQLTTSTAQTTTTTPTQPTTTAAETTTTTTSQPTTTERTTSQPTTTESFCETAARTVIYTTGTGNLALGKVATQISSWQDGSGNVASADKAVDGNRNPNWQTGWSCSVTLNEGSPWWQVDLGGDYKVTRVVITNIDQQWLTDMQNSLKVEVGNGQDEMCVCITRDTAPGPGETITLNCSQNIGGRILRMSLENGGHLVLCEVEVFSA